MGFRIILLLSIYLLVIGKSQDSIFKFHKKIYKRDFSTTWNKEASSLYDATQIGYKRSVNKDLIKAFKNLGIIHLLTPSGIHLASVLLILRKIINKNLLTILISIFLLVLKSIGGFYSIKRICIFYLFNTFLKSTRISFCLTFLVDLIIGGYADSPLSFALSFMFWGTIIFSQSSKYLIIINLFICQMISAYFFSNQLNIFSFFLNPIITGIFSSVFSFLSFQYWSNYFDFFDSISFLFIDLFSYIIKKLDANLFFANIYIGPLIFLIVLLPKKKHLYGLIIYIIFNSQPLNERLEGPYKSSYYLKQLDACKEYFGKYGYDKKCYFKDIKKAQKNWAKY